MVAAHYRTPGHVLRCTLQSEQCDGVVAIGEVHVQIVLRADAAVVIHMGLPQVHDTLAGMHIVDAADRDAFARDIPGELPCILPIPFRVPATELRRKLGTKPGLLLTRALDAHTHFVQACQLEIKPGPPGGVRPIEQTPVEEIELAGSLGDEACPDGSTVGKSDADFGGHTALLFYNLPPKEVREAEHPSPRLCMGRTRLYHRAYRYFTTVYSFSQRPTRLGSLKPQILRTIFEVFRECF